MVLGERVCGKPVDAADACAMLEALAGRTHQVLTAVVLVSRQRVLQELVVSEVSFAALDMASIAAYVASGEPMDKAGAYGIQGKGGCFVRSIEGSYSAVVGLPLVETRELFDQLQSLRSEKGSV